MFDRHVWVPTFDRLPGQNSFWAQSWRLIALNQPILSFVTYSVKYLFSLTVPFMWLRLILYNTVPFYARYLSLPYAKNIETVPIRNSFRGVLYVLLIIDGTVGEWQCLLWFCRSRHKQSNVMSGRAVLSDVGSGHALEVKTTDVTVTRQAHFDSSKTTGPLVCVCMFISSR